MSALRHGLAAETTVLPDEFAEGYEALRTQLHAELEPGGALECFLVDRIAAGACRLRRMGRVPESPQRPPRTTPDRFTGELPDWLNQPQARGVGEWRPIPPSVGTAPTNGSRRWRACA